VDRYRLRLSVGQYREPPEPGDLSETIRISPVSQKLLQHQNVDGEIASSKGAYQKWQGAHWALASLADIGYPANHPSLFRARDQMLDHWLSESFFREFVPKSKGDLYKYQKNAVPLLDGRYRRCASQQGSVCSRYSVNLAT
jgi:hypothetical protein